MVSLPIHIHIIFSFLAAIGFAVFLNSPKHALIYSGLIGTIGWIIYVYLMRLGLDIISSNFISALFVSFSSELLARILKNPVTLYVVPGIIPLIPGLGLYNTMFFLVQNNYDAAISTGTNTIFVGGSIALGVLVMSSLFRTYYRVMYAKHIKFKL